MAETWEDASAVPGAPPSARNRTVSSVAGNSGGADANSSNAAANASADGQPYTDPIGFQSGTSRLLELLSPGDYTVTVSSDNAKSLLSKEAKMFCFLWVSDADMNVVRKPNGEPLIRSVKVSRGAPLVFPLGTLDKALPAFLHVYLCSLETSDAELQSPAQYRAQLVVSGGKAALSAPLFKRRKRARQGVKMLTFDGCGTRAMIQLSMLLEMEKLWKESVVRSPSAEFKQQQSGGSGGSGIEPLDQGMRSMDLHKHAANAAPEDSGLGFASFPSPSSSNSNSGGSAAAGSAAGAASGSSAGATSAVTQEFRVSHVFDLYAGTGFGAIVCALLGLKMMPLVVVKQLWDGRVH